jgi:hypothetical protein
MRYKGRANSIWYEKWRKHLSKVGVRNNLIK